MKVAKSGWVTIESGVWSKIVPEANGDQTYELTLLCNDTGVGSVGVLGHLRRSWPYRGPKAEHFSLYSKPFAYVPKELSYTSIVRRFVRRTHAWADEQLSSPMTILTDLLTE